MMHVFGTLLSKKGLLKKGSRWSINPVMNCLTEEEEREGARKDMLGA